MDVLRPVRGSDEAACPPQLCDQCGVLAQETRLRESHSLRQALVAPGLWVGCTRDPMGTRFPDCPHWAPPSPFPVP